MRLPRSGAVGQKGLSPNQVGRGNAPALVAADAVQHQSRGVAPAYMRAKRIRQQAQETHRAKHDIRFCPSPYSLTISMPLTSGIAAGTDALPCATNSRPALSGAEREERFAGPDTLELLDERPPRAAPSRFVIRRSLFDILRRRRHAGPGPAGDKYHVPGTPLSEMVTTSSTRQRAYLNNHMVTTKAFRICLARWHLASMVRSSVVPWQERWMVTEIAIQAYAYVIEGDLRRATE